MCVVSLLFTGAGFWILQSSQTFFHVVFWVLNEGIILQINQLDFYTNSEWLLQKYKKENLKNYCSLKYYLFVANNYKEQ